MGYLFTSHYYGAMDNTPDRLIFFGKEKRPFCWSLGLVGSIMSSSIHISSTPKPLVQCYGQGREDPLPKVQGMGLRRCRRMPLLWREVAVQDALKKFTVAHPLLGVQMRKDKRRLSHEPPFLFIQIHLLASESTHTVPPFPHSMPLPFFWNQPHEVVDLIYGAFGILQRKRNILRYKQRFSGFVAQYANTSEFLFLKHFQHIFFSFLSLLQVPGRERTRPCHDWRSIFSSCSVRAFAARSRT